MSDGSELNMTYVPGYEQSADARALTGTFKGSAGVSYKPPFPWVSYTDSSGQPARRPAFAATWMPMEFQISDSGEIRISSDKDCSASGTIQPRPTGKNVFDAALTLRGSECVLEDGTSARGIGVMDERSGRLDIQTLNATKTGSFRLSGTKKE